MWARRWSPPLALEGVAGACGQGGLPPGGEEGGLVHVQPEARDPHLQKPLELLPPPGPGLGVGEVGEGGEPRPHRAPDHLPGGEAAEEPLPQALLVRGEPLLRLHPGVQDEDGAHPLLPETPHQARKVGVAALVHGEDAVAPHVVDVQVHRPQGEAPFQKARHPFLHLLPGPEPPAGVVEAQGPAGGHGGKAREAHVAAQGRLQGAGDEVVAEGPP